jgi:hypothetical protein
MKDKHDPLASRDSFSALPLHFVARYYTSSQGDVEVINHLIKCYPQALRVRDCMGHTPLDCALSNVHNPSPTAAQSFAKVFSGADVKYQHKGGFGFRWRSGCKQRTVKFCVQARGER